MNTETTTRPRDDEGQLLAGGTDILAPQAILEQVLPTLTQHLESVAWWPKDADEAGWRIGDFAFYILEFPVAPSASLYAQVWSEPDEAVLVEVSSGAWNPPAGEHISAAQREALLNRGFETGGRAGNFRKRVQVGRRDDCRRLARELLGVLTECLGYDGRAPLAFKRHLGRRTQAAQVFTSLTFDDLGRLLRSWGFPVETVGEDDRRTWRSAAGYPFIATLQADDDDRPGEFDGFTLSTFVTLPPGVLGPVEHELRETLPFARVSIDRDGDLQVGQIVYVAGGVTEAHLRRLLDFWRGALRVTHDTIERHREDVDAHVLN